MQCGHPHIPKKSTWLWEQEISKREKQPSLAMEGYQKWFNSQLCTSLKPHCYTINRRKLISNICSCTRTEGHKFYITSITYTCTYYLAFLTLFLVFSLHQYRQVVITFIMTSIQTTLLYKIIKSQQVTILFRDYFIFKSLPKITIQPPSERTKLFKWVQNTLIYIYINHSGLTSHSCVNKEYFWHVTA